MEDGRKKIWICILTVVLAAVVIGLLYYLSTPREQGAEGFLIRRTGQSYCVDKGAEEEAYGI